MKTIKLTGKVKAVPMQPHLVGQTLAGIKTNTRRLITEQMEPSVSHFEYDELHKAWVAHDKDGIHTSSFIPRYQPGDLLYITEKHRIMVYKELDFTALIRYDDGVTSVHKSSKENIDKIKSNFRDTWRPARFMFKDFTRCVVLVEDARPERLFDITEEDAIAEGVLSTRQILPLWCQRDSNAIAERVLSINTDSNELYWNYLDKKWMANTAISSFFTLWYSIHPLSSRDLTEQEYNPWVWRYQFRKIWEGDSWYLHEPEVIASLQKELAV